jgi:hypothetical protein
MTTPPWGASHPGTPGARQAQLSHTRPLSSLTQSPPRQVSTSASPPNAARTTNRAPPLRELRARSAAPARTCSGRQASVSARDLDDERAAADAPLTSRGRSKAARPSPSRTSPNGRESTGCTPRAAIAPVPQSTEIASLAEIAPRGVFAPRQRRCTDSGYNAICRRFESGRQDLNLRPPGPQPEGSGCVERLQPSRAGSSCSELGSVAL